MKTLTYLSIALIYLTTANAAETDKASKVAHGVKILEIKSLIQQTPQFQASGIKDKVVKPRYWLEIEAELEVMTTDPSGFIPELEANWYAVVIDKVTNKSVRLTGKSTFKNVRTKDKKAFISAYIEPDTLEKMTGKDKPSEREVEAIALTISGANILSEGKYAAGLEKATDKESAKWWSIWSNVTMEGLILAKSKTPFAPLWLDRYPAEKPVE